MSDDKVDAGFDDVAAGLVWKPPDLSTATVHPEPNVNPTPASEFFSPLNSGEGDPAVTPDYAGAGPITATVTTPGLTPEGVQAAKALVRLPMLDLPALAKMAREIAMDIKERSVILKEFGLSEAQYDFLQSHNDFYKSALAAACKEWHAPLTTTERIRIEAAAILEDSLPGLGARMQNKVEGLPGVVEAAKLFAKVAGVGEREAGGAAPGERFVINIDLGGDQKLVVQSTPAPASAAVDAVRTALLRDGEV